MKPLKLALVVGAFPKLSETFVLQQIVCLLEAGHDVRIFAFEEAHEAVQHPAVEAFGLRARTTYLKAPERLSSKLQALGRRTVGREPQRFDAIVCHFGHVGERARKLRNMGVFSGPLAVIFHAYDLTVWLRERSAQAYAALIAEAELLLPISQHWQRRLLELGANAERISVLHMGVDCQAFAYKPRQLEAGELVKLLSVGRLVEKKGISYALEALALASSMLSVSYHIVGDGPLRAELEEQARQLGLASKVRFHGALPSPRVRELMNEMHGLLAPSVTAADGDMEGIPVVLMEAMAQGLPVISTTHSGIPELVRRGDTGITVPERDAPALASALVDWSNAVDTWADTSARARALVENEFDATKLAQQLVGELARRRGPA